MVVDNDAAEDSSIFNYIIVFLVLLTAIKRSKIEVYPASDKKTQLKTLFHILIPTGLIIPIPLKINVRKASTEYEKAYYDLICVFIIYLYIHHDKS